MKPLPLEEKEYRLSLLRTERRAIIPIKWFILIVTAGLWLGLIRDAPGTPVMMLFGAYALFILLETYYFYSRKVSIDRIKPLALSSYLVDVVFVTLLIYFDIATYYLHETPLLAGMPRSNFYIIYFLLVMRGFALFKTVLETVLLNALISVLFILTLRLEQTSFAFAREPEFAMQLVLIWLVVLMAWFIMVVLNQQKMDLIQTHEKLLRADHLAQLGELAAGVAHEINNPLGIIIATSEYLEKTTDPDDPRAEEIAALHRESNRCKEIVEQMLAYAKPKPGNISLFNAAELNEEVVNFVFPKSRSNLIEVVKEYEDRLPSIRANPNLIKQALLNLYVNAKQAIPPGTAGRIVTRVYNRKRPPSVTFEIEDNGVGVDPDDLAYVFDPFFTRKEEGTGLGLAVVQSIVESFGGTISIEPAQPKGTKVLMQFPAVEG